MKQTEKKKREAEKRVVATSQTFSETYHMWTFLKRTLRLLERSPANDQARKVSNLLELHQSTRQPREFVDLSTVAQTMENSRGISWAPNALPKTLCNFLACIPRTVVGTSSRYACIVPNFVFNPIAHAKNVFEERHWLLFRDALCSTLLLYCRDDFERSHRHQSIPILSGWQTRLSHASRNFSFGRTHEIFPRRTAIDISIKLTHFLHRVYYKEIHVETNFAYHFSFFFPNHRQWRRFLEIEWSINLYFYEYIVGHFFSNRILVRLYWTSLFARVSNIKKRLNFEVGPSSDFKSAISIKFIRAKKQTLNILW